MRGQSISFLDLRVRHSVAIVSIIVVVFTAASVFLCSGVAAEDWPQFRGPQRNGISRETGLLQKWPKGGPKLLWKADGIGEGYSSAAVAKGRVFVTGDIGNRLVITALDLNGHVLWRANNGKSWKGSYPGARATCTVAPDGKLYHVNAHGRITCLGAATGREIWTVNVLERFDAQNIYWGMSEALLIVGPNLVATVGGPKALMVALDRQTGKPVWTTPPLRFLRKEKFGGGRLKTPYEDFEKAGYASPILIRLPGHALIAGAAGRHVFLVDADSGQRTWSTFVPARWEVIGTAPVWTGNSVLFAAPYDFGAALFRVTENDSEVSVAKAWETPVDNCHGGFVFVDGKFFGSGYRRFRGWACVDAANGRVLYKKTDLKKGSIVYADGRLYAFGENGEIALLAAAEKGFEECGRFRVPNARGNDNWAHPSISGRRLYLRCGDILWCYDIRRK